MSGTGGAGENVDDGGGIWINNAIITAKDLETKGYGGKGEKFTTVTWGTDIGSPGYCCKFFSLPSISLCFKILCSNDCIVNPNTTSVVYIFACATCTTQLNFSCRCNSIAMAILLQRQEKFN